MYEVSEGFSSRGGGGGVEFHLLPIPSRATPTAQAQPPSSTPPNPASMPEGGLVTSCHSPALRPRLRRVLRRLSPTVAALEFTTSLPAGVVRITHVRGGVEFHLLPVPSRATPTAQAQPPSSTPPNPASMPEGGLVTSCHSPALRPRLRRVLRRLSPTVAALEFTTSLPAGVVRITHVRGGVVCTSRGGWGRECVCFVFRVLVISFCLCSRI